MAALREMSADLAVQAPPPPPPPAAKPAAVIVPSTAESEGAGSGVDVLTVDPVVFERSDGVEEVVAARSAAVRGAVPRRSTRAPLTSASSTRSRSFLVSPAAADVLAERSRTELAGVVVAEAVNATVASFPSRVTGPVPLSSRRAPNTATVLRRVRMTDAQHAALVELAERFSVSVSVLVSTALERSVQ